MSDFHDKNFEDVKWHPQIKNCGLYKFRKHGWYLICLVHLIHPMTLCDLLTFKVSNAPSLKWTYSGFCLYDFLKTIVSWYKKLTVPNSWNTAYGLVSNKILASCGVSSICVFHPDWWCIVTFFSNEETIIQTMYRYIILNNEYIPSELKSHSMIQPAIQQLEETSSKQDKTSRM